MVAADLRVLTSTKKGQQSNLASLQREFGHAKAVFTWVIRPFKGGEGGMRWRGSNLGLGKRKGRQPPSCLSTESMPIHKKGGECSWLIAFEFKWQLKWGHSWQGIGCGVIRQLTSHQCEGSQWLIHQLGFPLTYLLSRWEKNSHFSSQRSMGLAVLYTNSKCMNNKRGFCQGKLENSLAFHPTPLQKPSFCAYKTLYKLLKVLTYLEGFPIKSSQRLCLREVHPHLWSSGRIRRTKLYFGRPLKNAVVRMILSGEKLWSK